MNSNSLKEEKDQEPKIKIGKRSPVQSPDERQFRRGCGFFCDGAVRPFAIVRRHLQLHGRHGME